MKIRSWAVTFVTAIAASAMLAISPVAAQTARRINVVDATPRRTLEVSGRGEVKVAPDQAFLNLAIETHAATAAECARDNAELAQKVVAALRAKLGNKGKVWTGGYSLYPEYNNLHQGAAKPAIVGYRADNSITVETGAIDLLGPLIDTAIGAGANRINYLNFGLRDDTQARGQAIAEAAKDAASQAKALASALNVKLGNIIKASTVSQSHPIVPELQFGARAMAAAPTPIAPNQITVPATVSLVYEIQ